MNKEQLNDGIYAIGEYLHELTKVGEDDSPTDENKHILHFYKVLDALSEHIKRTEDEGYYPITSLHKDDIIQCYEGSDEEEDVKKAVEELTEDQMKYMAKKMADSFCDCCYWDALKCRFEYTKYDDWKKDKEEKEYDRKHGTE